jgi:hypothetical protein
MLKFQKISQKETRVIRVKLSPQLHHQVERYCEAYHEAYNEQVTLEELIPIIVETFLREDKGFQTYLRKRKDGSTQ